MRKKRSLAMLVAAAATAASGVLSVGAAASATTPLPSVLTVDTANSVYVSQGSAPVKLRNGTFAVYPWAASLDGATSLWTIGSAFGQITLVHNGVVKRIVNNVSAYFYAGDVTPDGRFAVVGVVDPNTTDQLDISVITVATGGVQTFHIGGASSMMDITLSQDGSTLYVLEAGTPPKLISCVVLTLSCSTANLTGLTAPTSDAAIGTWATVSADGTTLAFNLITNPESTTTFNYEGYVITGLGGVPAVRDAGSMSGYSWGRFIDNALYVADQGHVYSYLTAANFAGLRTRRRPSP